MEQELELIELTNEDEILDRFAYGHCSIDEYDPVNKTVRFWSYENKERKSDGIFPFNYWGAGKQYIVKLDKINCSIEEFVCKGALRLEKFALKFSRIEVGTILDQIDREIKDIS